MKSKKGVIITVGILIAITAASFSVWIVNTTIDTEMTIVVTDFENHQQGISERYKIVSNAVDESFSELMNDKISPEEYTRIAEISSSQNTALLTELRTVMRQKNGRRVTSIVLAHWKTLGRIS